MHNTLHITKKRVQIFVEKDFFPISLKRVSSEKAKRDQRIFLYISEGVSCISALSLPSHCTVASISILSSSFHLLMMKWW